MSDDATASIGQSYDRLASDYARKLAHELDRKPFDRALLERFVAAVAARGDVCDVGCGPGQVARFLHAAGCPVFGIDLSARMVREARLLSPGISFRQGDMAHLDIENATLAGVVAFYAIVNIPQASLEPIFREIERVLKPGGLLLLSFHVGDKIVRERELWGHAISMAFYFFETPAICALLTNAGLTVEEALERDPYPPKVEYQSRRAYVFARKPRSDDGEG